MSTWHQNQNPVRLWHDTLWTYVDDQPGKHMGVMRYATAKEANEARDARGVGYVLPPGNVKGK